MSYGWREDHALHAELADIGVGVAEVEAQPIATENHILPEPDSGKPLPLHAAPLKVCAGPLCHLRSRFCVLSGELMDQLRSTLDYCLSR